MCCFGLDFGLDDWRYFRRLVYFSIKEATIVFGPGIGAYEHGIGACEYPLLHGPGLFLVF